MRSAKKVNEFTLKNLHTWSQEIVALERRENGGKQKLPLRALFTAAAIGVATGITLATTVAISPVLATTAGVAAALYGYGKILKFEDDRHVWKGVRSASQDARAQRSMLSVGMSEFGPLFQTGLRSIPAMAGGAFALVALKGADAASMHSAFETAAAYTGMSFVGAYMGVMADAVLGINSSITLSVSDIIARQEKVQNRTAPVAFHSGMWP